MKHATRIALVADTHTWPSAAGAAPFGDDYAAMLLDESDALHALLLEEIAASGATVALHLGDMTCGGGFFNLPNANFAPLLARLHGDFASLPMPMLALPGNHDTPPGNDGSSPSTGGWALFEQLWGLERGLGATVDVDGLRLLLINAQGHDAAQIQDAQPGDPVYGWLSEGELARVDEALASAGGRPVLAFVHQLVHPWRTPYRPWKPYYAVRNADALLRVLARRRGVRVLFQAHAHRYEQGELGFNGFRALSVLAPSIIEYPVGWLQLDVRADGMRVTLRQLPRPDLIRRSLCDGAQAWRAPDALRVWSATW